MRNEVILGFLTQMIAIIIISRKRLRIYTIVVFFFVRTFAP